MAVNDIYKLDLGVANIGSGAHNGVNVFYYRVATQTGGIDAEMVADEFIDSVVPSLTAPLTNNWIINNLFVQNLMVPADFNETNPDITNDHTGVALPAFMAGNVRSPWPGSGFNRARHRIFGFSCSDLADNGLWEASAEALLNDIALACGAVMVTSGGTLHPCIITPAQPNADPPVALQFRADVQGQWEYSRVPTTQNSRKRPPVWVPGAEA